jgi:hypothetical protein
LEESSKGSGMIKLFNVGFLPYSFNNMSERDALKGRDFYSYRGSDYQSLKGITYEELNFLNGQLNGVSKAYLGNVLDFAMNIGTSGPKEISYYQNSKLVYVTTFLPNYKEYSYEFDNGVNLTLKKVDENLISISNYIVEMKKSLSQNDFDIFLENSKKAVAIIGETENYCKNLNIPSDKCQVKIDKKGDELSLVIDQAEKKVAALNAQREKENQEFINQFVKAAMNQANGYAEKGYSSGNSSSTYSNSNSKSKGNCSSCNGTGECRSCNKTVKKNYRDFCTPKTRNERRLGYVICSQCYGYGYESERGSVCDCPGGIGWCNGKKCYLSDCNDGWRPCKDCNSGGRGSNVGKCQSCKGTGTRN